MSNRKKVKIKVESATQLQLILKELGLAGNIEVVADLDDTKDNLKYLCTSKYISDWDFIEEKEADENSEPLILDSEEKQPKKEGEPEAITCIQGIHSAGTGEYWNELAAVIEAIWKTAQESPSLKYGTGFFCNAVMKNKEFVSFTSPEHALLTMLTHTYYMGTAEQSEVYLDLEQKLEHLWIHGEFGGKSLSEIAKTLYKT